MKKTTILAFLPFQIRNWFVKKCGSLKVMRDTSTIYLIFLYELNIFKACFITSTNRLIAERLEKNPHPIFTAN